MNAHKIYKSNLIEKYQYIALILLGLLFFKIGFTNEETGEIIDPAKNIKLAEQDLNLSKESIANNQEAFTELSKILANLQFINAEFTQSIENKAGIILQEQAGTIQLKKPNLLNWQVLSPDRLSIVIDGEKIWNYDIDLEQIIVKKITDELNDNLVSKILLGDVAKNLNHFAVAYTEEHCTTNKCFVLHNQPNMQEQTISFSSCYLGFNRKNQLILLKLFDQLEQEITFNFFNFKNRIDNKAFRFVAPAGIDLIEED